MLAVFAGANDVIVWRCLGRRGHWLRENYLRREWLVWRGHRFTSFHGLDHRLHAGPNDFVIDRNHAAYQELLAMALTAYTRDLDVQLIVEKGDCGFGGRTKISAMRFEK